MKWRSTRRAAPTSSGSSDAGRTGPRFSVMPTWPGPAAPHGVHGQPVPEQKVVRGGQRLGVVGSAGGVHAGPVPEPGRHPRLVQRDPHRHLVAQGAAVHRALGDQVAMWITLNEPWVRGLARGTEPASTPPAEQDDAEALAAHPPPAARRTGWPWMPCGARPAAGHGRHHPEPGAGPPCVGRPRRTSRPPRLRGRSTSTATTLIRCSPGGYPDRTWWCYYAKGVSDYGFV